MKKISSIIVLISLITCGLVCSSQNEKLQVPKKDSVKVPSEKFVLKGILELEGEKPAKGVTVFLFPYKQRKISSPIVEEEGKFRLGCPGAKTDEKGHFRIEFSPTYLEKHKTKEFVLGVFRVVGGADPFRDAEAPFALPIFGVDQFDNHHKLDVMGIFKKIVVDLNQISPIEPAKNP